MAAPAATHSGHVIGGREVTGDGGYIDVLNPATEQVVGSVAAGTAADVDAAVAAATEAFPGWSATPAAERSALIRAVAAGLADSVEELATLISSEMGSPLAFARMAQAGMSSSGTAGIANLLDEFVFSQELANSLVVREPIGVVGAITPWNFPLQLVLVKVIPAIAMGNTVVLKPSEVAPLCTNVLLRVLAAAGVPDGVVNLVHGTGPVAGEALAAHPGVDMISFTGSTRAGRRVSEVAAGTVKRVALELGGKSANVILDDADLTKAVTIGVANAYMNGGQACNAWTRMLVPAARQDEVAELAAAAAANYTVGDPLDEQTKIGPMASAAQRDRVLGYIASGLREGARVVHGGEVDSLPEVGAYVPTTVFADVRPEMTIAQEEIFGPVLSIMPYADDDDAVRIANSTIYGLHGAVFSGDSERALSVAKRIRTGQVDINAAPFNRFAPFGGYKQSGNGRELGHFGLEEFTELKSIQR